MTSEIELITQGVLLGTEIARENKTPIEEDLILHDCLIALTMNLR